MTLRVLGNAFFINKKGAFLQDTAYWIISAGMGCIVFCAVYIVWLRMQLKRQINLFSEAFDTPAHGLIFFDENDRFIQANEQAPRYFPALARSDHQYKKLSDYIDFFFDHAVEEGDPVKNVLQKSAYKLKGVGFREIYRLGNGLFCQVEAQRTDAGGTVLVLFNVNAVRDHERDVIMLNQSNYGLHQAVQAADNGIVVLLLQNGRFLVQFANQSFCEIFALPVDQVVDMNFEDIIGAEIVFGLDEELVIKAKAGKPVEGEIELKTSRGQFWYDLKIKPMDEDPAQEGLYVGVFTDTTEIKAREAQMFNAQKLEALGRLSAGVAHDFNNLLSIIDGYARIVIQNIGDSDPDSVDCLERVRVTADRGAAITKQMLAFSRHRISSNVVVNLREVIEQQASLLAPLLGERVEYSFKCEEETVPVETSSDFIAQIIMNLVINARDAIPGPGTVCVSLTTVAKSDIRNPLVKNPETLSSAKKFACIEVKDSGMGIPDAVMKQMFDPFFTTKEQGKGTGLGLSMVHGLVEQVGGMIDVSTTVGQHTSFYIYLPITERDVTRTIQGDIENIEEFKLKGYTVIVAEDEPDLLSLVCDMLEQTGLTVLRAKDGNEALVRYDDHDGKVDMLLTDVVMPELSGVDSAGLMNALDPDIKVVFMSGYPRDGDLTELNLPDDAIFLAKPVLYEKLVKMIYKTLVPSGKTLSSEGASSWDVSDTDQMRGEE